MHVIQFILTRMRAFATVRRCTHKRTKTFPITQNQRANEWLNERDCSKFVFEMLVFGVGDSLEFHILGIVYFYFIFCLLVLLCISYLKCTEMYHPLSWQSCTFIILSFIHTSGNCNLVACVAQCLLLPTTLKCHWTIWHTFLANHLCLQFASVWQRVRVLHNYSAYMYVDVDVGRRF